MNTAWLKARQTRFGAYVTLYVLLIIAILGLLNWLANRHNKSVDTTANKQFSLSGQTEKVVGGLEQNAKITYFDKSSDFQRAKDLLARYDNLSPKLSVDYIDPDKKPNIARAAGVRSYGSIYVEAGTRREEAKSLTEEEITGALIRALKGGEKTVCSVTGSGEHTFEDTERTGYSQAKDLIERNNYKTRTISLIEKPEIPKDCTVIMIAGPRFEYTEPAVNALKTFVEGGGRVLFMADPPVNLAREKVSENPRLAGLLGTWGVTPQNNLVVDASGIGQIFGLSEVVPLVSNYESHPIVREMKGVATAFPLARSIDSKSADKTSVQQLFQTSENSFATTNLSSAELRLDPSQAQKGPFTLAVAGTYTTGKENSEGRFVVVGSSGWIANNILRFNGNSDLFVNMLNWLSSDEDLISIRPKDPQDRRLALNRQQMRLIFMSSVVLLPLAVIVAGVGVWWRRR
jgi:ABC-type uncharacterized transport system involved in gliding motility auxiliary subunit